VAQFVAQLEAPECTADAAELCWRGLVMWVLAWKGDSRKSKNFDKELYTFVYGGNVEKHSHGIFPTRLNGHRAAVSLSRRAMNAAIRSLDSKSIW